MPVSVKQLRLEDDLLAYLQAVPTFCFNESELNSAGFQRCVDHPAVPGHHYYEGYFHGLPKPSPEPSINPRGGFEMLKPAAPLPLRAFIVEFKRLNESWIDKCLQGTDDCSKFFRGLKKKNYHFSDCAVQIHSGDVIKEPHIGWHSDAPNSTLHLALSIRGNRSLHSRMANNISDEGMELKVFPQTPGDVYVSSPFAFPHGVEYAEAKTWEDRIIAIQIRFLLTLQDYHDMREHYEHLEAFMDKVTCALEKGNVVLPTLKQVQDAAKGMKEADDYVWQPPVSKKLPENPAYTTSTTDWRERDAAAGGVDGPASGDEKGGESKSSDKQEESSAPATEQPVGGSGSDANKETKSAQGAGELVMHLDQNTANQAR